MFEGWHMKKLLLLLCFSAQIKFLEATFDFVRCNEILTNAKDEENYAIVTLKNQLVACKANILG